MSSTMNGSSATRRDGVGRSGCAALESLAAENLEYGNTTLPSVRGILGQAELLNVLESLPDVCRPGFGESAR